MYTCIYIYIYIALAGAGADSPVENVGGDLTPLNRLCNPRNWNPRPAALNSHPSTLDPQPLTRIP